MALTEVLAFKGKSEILGRILPVEFEGDELRIKVGDLAEAYRVIKALAIGRVIGVDPATGETTKGQPEQALASVSSTTPTTPAEGKSGEVVSMVGLTKGSKKTQAVATAPASVTAPAESVVVPPVMKVDAPATAAGAVAAPQNGASDLGVQLGKCTSMREVVRALVKQGYSMDNPVEMAKACLPHVSDSTLLKRIGPDLTKMTDRIKLGVNAVKVEEKA